MSYEKINIGNPPQAEEIVIEEEEKTELEEPTLQEVVIEEAADSEDSEVQEEEKPKSKAGRPKGSKNKKRDKRIQQLVERAKKAEEQAEQIAQENEYYKEQLFNSTKNSYSSKQKALETELSSLEQKLQNALDEDDTAEAVKLQKELTQTMMEFAAVNYELQSAPKEYVPQQREAQTEPSDYALGWVDDHPEFNNDIEFRNAALGVNSKLINEGFDPDSEEFYQELDKRLSRRYPEFYDINSEDVVQLDSGNKNPPASKSSETENIESEDDYPQTVAGASRTPSGSTSVKKSRKNSKNTVILTEEDKNIMQNWGIDPIQYAKRKKLMEESEKGDYVPIIIPTDK
jgi:hypothetical protein